MKNFVFQTLIVVSLLYFGQSIAMTAYQDNQAQKAQELGLIQADRPVTDSSVRL